MGATRPLLQPAKCGSGRIAKALLFHDFPDAPETGLQQLPRPARIERDIARSETPQARPNRTGRAGHRIRGVAVRSAEPTRELVPGDRIRACDVEEPRHVV